MYRPVCMNVYAGNREPECFIVLLRKMNREGLETQFNIGHNIGVRIGKLALNCRNIHGHAGISYWRFESCQLTIS